MNNNMKTGKKTILIASIGTILEFYDFAIYIYIAPILSTLFFPEHDKILSMIAIFGAFAMGYLMRPIGGIFFGNLGDRIGRRKTLLLSMLLMFIPMLLTSILPTYSQIGALAGIILISTRIMQGFSVGGEFSGVIVMLAEQAVKNKRGLMVTLAAFVGNIGLLLSSSIVLLLTEILTKQQMLSWGWRIPFMIGALACIIILALRSGLDESPLFQKIAKNKKSLNFPLFELIAKHLRKIIIATLLIGFYGFTFYLLTTFFPTYFKNISQLSYKTTVILSIFTSISIITALPIFGFLSDKYGRKPICYFSLFGFMFLGYFMFNYLIYGSILLKLISILIFAVLIAAYAAVATPMVCELFHTEIRYSGLGLTYNLGSALFGGTAPLLSTYLIKWTGNPLSPSFYLIIFSIIMIFIVFFLKETAFTDLK